MPGWDNGALDLPTAAATPAAPAAANGAPAAAAAAAVSRGHTPQPPPEEGAYRGGSPSQARAPAPDAGPPFGGAHVLEVFNLTSADTTAQLERFAGRHPPERGCAAPALRWVNEHSAVLVYTDPLAARAALQALGALEGQAAAYSVRPYADASPAARRLPASELQPPKARPATTAAAARRLIGGALNMRGLADREEEARLAAARRELRDARVAERERGAARERELAAAWGD